jgi:hypothetical protein
MALKNRLERRYGQRQLHFITCSCYRRRPLLGTTRKRDAFLKILDEVRERYQFSLVGLRGDARTHSSADFRAGGGESEHGDAGFEATRFAISETKRAASESESIAAVARGARSNAAQFLAETVLRFQRVEREEAN